MLSCTGSEYGPCRLRSELSNLAISIAVQSGELAVQGLHSVEDMRDILALPGMAYARSENRPFRLEFEMSHLIDAIAAASWVPCSVRASTGLGLWRWFWRCPTWRHLNSRLRCDISSVLLLFQHGQSTRKCFSLEMIWEMFWRRPGEHIHPLPSFTSVEFRRADYRTMLPPRAPTRCRFQDSRLRVCPQRYHRRTSTSH